MITPLYFESASSASERAPKSARERLLSSRWMHQRLVCTLTLRSAISRALVAMAASNTRTFCVDPFCFRQFEDETYLGTRLAPVKISQFEEHINQLWDDGKVKLVDGYAPFCKHLFIPNFTPAKGTTLEITPENEHLLRSGYDARTEQELPVLVRWFPAESVPEPPVAKFLDVILYSREQIKKEAAAMGRADEQSEPWGIISVKAQDVDFELPMQPITMLRNTLVEEGGSGVALDREKYMESVDFWKKHATIK